MEIEEGNPGAGAALVGAPASHAALPRARKGERRVLVASVITMISLLGTLLLMAHVTMQDYLIALGSWPH